MIRVDMGPWPVDVWVGNNPKKIKKFCKDWSIEDQSDPVGDFCIYATSDTQALVLITIRPEHKGADFFSVLAHEASHAADRVFEYTEEEFPGTEARAYIVSHIIDQCKGLVDEVQV